MALAFKNTNISFSRDEDIVSIVQLLNKAYRGNASSKGWTTESHLIAGEVRTTNSHIQEVLQKENTVFLLYKRDKQLIGCVNLQLQGNKVYLGMFAVDLNLQGGGVGKALLQASEEWVCNSKCSTIYMTVISVRTELIDWYKRNGYKDTGERIPFNEDGYSGTHLQPLTFMVLEKSLNVY